MVRRKGKSGISETLMVPKSKEEDEETGKGFYACYLLTSLSPRHKGHTYIGYTVNPRRRIRQHNGEIRNGAWRTKSKRPWEMVLCIYGFPTSVSALQFEWAWQHPKESLAVRKAAASFKSFSGVVNKIKLAYTMLTLPSWQSLNFTVNYFSTKYTKHSCGCPSLPQHMKVQVRLMDELPCYAEGYESSFDNEDDFDKGEECEAADTTIMSAPDILTDPTVHNPACNQVGSDINPQQYGSSPAREASKEDCSHLFGPVRMKSSIDTTSFKMEEIALEFFLPRRKRQLQDSSNPGDSEEPFGSPSTVSCYSNMQETTVELGWPREKQLADAVASENYCSSANGIASCEVEVIDLLTPSPDCRILSCSSKRRRVPTVFPAIIDLTKSPIFVQL